MQSIIIDTIEDLDDLGPPPKKIIEYCNNAEILADGRESEIDADEYAREYVCAAIRAAEADPALAGCLIVRPGGNRSLLCQWNGAHFTTRIGRLFGAFADLTEEEIAALEEANAVGFGAADDLDREALAQEEEEAELERQELAAALAAEAEDRHEVIPGWTLEEILQREG